MINKQILASGIAALVGVVGVADAAPVFKSTQTKTIFASPGMDPENIPSVRVELPGMEEGESSSNADDFPAGDIVEFDSFSTAGRVILDAYIEVEFESLQLVADVSGVNSRPEVSASPAPKEVGEIATDFKAVVESVNILGGAGTLVAFDADKRFLVVPCIAEADGTDLPAGQFAFGTCVGEGESSDQADMVNAFDARFELVGPEIFDGSGFKVELVPTVFAKLAFLDGWSASGDAELHFEAKIRAVLEYTVVPVPGAAVLFLAGGIVPLIRRARR